MDEAVERLTSLEQGTLFAGYRIDGMLDRGGMGVVYRATDEDLSRTVALKIIAPEHTQNPDAVRRFKAEARLAASLEHPNIVPIHRGGEYRGVLYLAMRFVPGTNLRHVINGGQLSLDRVQRIMTAVASALDAAHESGLVHRDVKPANILLSGTGEHEHVYLTDFGLTKRLGSQGSLTRTGAWVGTPDYVAPEQIRAGTVDGRADIYSLGCVLYEMLTGEVAYPKDNDMAKLWAHVQDPCPLPSTKRDDLVQAFDDVVARATAKEPEDRFARASEMALAVDAAAAEQRAHLGSAGLQATRAAGADARSVGEHDVFLGEPTQARAPVPAAPLNETTPAPMSAPVFDWPSTHEQPQIADQAPPPPPTPPPSERAAAVPPRGPGRPPRQGGRSRLLIALGLVGVIVVAAAAFLLTRGDSSGTSTPAPAVAATKLPEGLAWQPISDVPFRRQYAASTAVDGKVWLFGGIASRTSSTTTKSFDPKSNAWSTGPGLPVPLHHFSAVTYKGEAVVIGGFIPGPELTSSQSDGVYVLRDGTWERLPSLHHKRAAAAAAVVGDKIVVVGGQANGKLVPQTEVFDGKRWTDKADIPTPREHLGAASDGRYVYAVGGRALSADKNSEALERYDPGSNRWTKLKAQPDPQGSEGVAYAGGRIVTVGGEGTTTASDKVFGYDIKNDTWGKLPSLGTGVHGAAVTALGTTIYAIGGATQPGHVGSTNKAEILDLSGGDASPARVDVKWRKVADAPTKIQYAAAADLGGRAWIFGGIGAGDKPTAETAAYDRAINTWTTGPKLPDPVNHASAVNYKGEAVVIGGFLPGSDGLTSGVSDRVYVLNGDSWEQLPSLNHARAAAAAAVVNGKIVVVGGQADGKLVPDTEVFDGNEWTEAAPIPTPREHLGAASDGRYLYAVGGRELSASKNLDAFERYDPVNDTWTKLDSMPKAAGSVGVAFVRDRVVAVGGEGATTVSDDVQAYNVKTQRWSQLSPLPEGRHGMAVTTLSDSLYAIGGAASAGHVDSTKDTFVLDDFG